MSVYVRQFFALTALFLFIFIALFISIRNLAGALRAPQTETGANTSSTTTAEEVTAETPVVETPTAAYIEPRRIIIESVGINTPVLNPQSTDVAVLDQALLSGAVRYPTAGLLGGAGNVYVFAHSTGLPVVKNQNFKAFNNLKDVRYGEKIIVQSDDREYLYRVNAVTMEKDSNIRIPLQTTKRVLTLSTCNTFGAKEDRYVVEAYYVTDYPLYSSEVN